MAKYQVSANGTDFGFYCAANANAACDACAIDAGYKSCADMQSQLDSPSELIATEIASDQYQMRYSHGGTVGELVITANSDTEAQQQLRKFVSDGFRNETWASIELNCGRTYSAENKHGIAKGGYVGESY